MIEMIYYLIYPDSIVTDDVKQLSLGEYLNDVA